MGQASLSGSGSGTGSGASFGHPAQPIGLALGRGPRHRRGRCVSRQTATSTLRHTLCRPLTAFGPGVDLTYPNDPYLLPFMELEQPVTFDRKAPTRITNELLKRRLIASPEERSLALQRIANGAIASRQLFMAHNRSRKQPRRRPK